MDKEKSKGQRENPIPQRQNGRAPAGKLAVRGHSRQFASFGNLGLFQDTLPAIVVVMSATAGAMVVAMMMAMPVVVSAAAGAMVVAVVAMFVVVPTATGIAFGRGILEAVEGHVATNFEGLAQIEREKFLAPTLL